MRKCFLHFKYPQFTDELSMYNFKNHLVTEVSTLPTYIIVFSLINVYL